MSLDPKPYSDDLDDLPPPIPYTGPDRRRPDRRSPDRSFARHSDAISHLTAPLWLLAGLTIAGLALGSPGCVGPGGPVVSGKVDVSVKETSGVMVAHVGNGGPAGGTGEVAASVSIALTWPSK